MSSIRINRGYSQVYHAIRQRLMYSFDFTFEQADKEIDFLFVTLTTLGTQDYYIKTLRKHATKRLTRQQKLEVWKHTKAIVEAHNYNIGV